MIDIKMSEVFPEGIDPSQIQIDNECVHDFYDDGCKPQEMAAHAINTYDPMVERIRVLEEALKGLLDSPHTKLSKGALLEVSEIDIDSAIKALGGSDE